jgi:hypothetical protein
MADGQNPKIKLSKYQHQNKIVRICPYYKNNETSNEPASLASLIFYCVAKYKGPTISTPEETGLALI